MGKPGAHDHDEEVGFFAHARAQLLGAHVETLAPLGWAAYGQWSMRGTRRIVELVRSGEDPAVIDELVTDLWHTESAVFFRNIGVPLRRYGKDIDSGFQRLQHQRANLVYQAVRCHQDGNYAAAILLTLAQIDGLTRDITGATFFSNATNDRYLDDATLAGVDSNLPVVRELFSERVETTDFHRKLSRHGATHGRDLAFGTKVMSTKTLVLLGALIEYLEGRSKGVARKYRRLHKAAAKKLTGVDESGRLRDDRELDQLALFAVELDGYIRMSMFSLVVDEAAWLERAYGLMHQKGLRRGAFTWGGGGAAAYWWHYRVPGGWSLGAAGRRIGTDTSITWQQWRWDDQDPPQGAPWDHGGWRDYDGEPTSPNWDMEPFPVG